MHTGQSGCNHPSFVYILCEIGQCSGHRPIDSRAVRSRAAPPCLAVRGCSPAGCELEPARSAFPLRGRRCGRREPSSRFPSLSAPWLSPVGREGLTRVIDARRERVWHTPEIDIVTYNAHCANLSGRIRRFCTNRAASPMTQAPISCT